MWLGLRTNGCVSRLTVLLVSMSFMLPAWRGIGYCACEYAQSCPTLCSPLDCNPPGSSVHGMFQAKILELAAISYSRGSSWPRDLTCISVFSVLAGEFFTPVPPGKPLLVTLIFIVNLYQCKSSNFVPSQNYFGSFWSLTLPYQF